MKDYLTLTKLTELFRASLELVGNYSFPMEDFTAAATFEPTSETSQVLRELTQEEASLFFADYSLFRALQEKIRPLSQAGTDPFISQGGIFYRVMEGLSGLGIKTLILMARREFLGDARLEGMERVVRIELIGDALCYTAVSLNPQDVAKAMAQAVKVVIVAEGHPGANDTNHVDEDFNLEAWNPDKNTFQ